jgi:hypothetical protein
LGVFANWFHHSLRHVVYNNLPPTLNRIQFWEGGVDMALAFCRGNITHLTNVDFRILKNVIEAEKPKHTEVGGAKNYFPRKSKKKFISS